MPLTQFPLQDVVLPQHPFIRSIVALDRPKRRSYTASIISPPAISACAPIWLSSPRLHVTKKGI
jgi:hypothetical protein